MSDAAHSDPVEYLPTDRRSPDPGIALCLSGGGYRAMVFHVGVIWRLYEAGLLGKLDRISSVSGGSITSAMLGLAWDRLQPASPPERDRLEQHFVKKVRKLAGETIDAWGIVGGILLPGTISDKIQASYRKHLFGDATLQALPDAPRFVINATNVQSGALWRFSKPYMRDWRVGEVKNPTVSLAEAVTASSAFPPVLSPMVMELDSSAFTPGSGEDLQREPYTSRVVLSDGGVYDNLGLETAWKRYDTILVSDAGGKLKPEEEPKEDWARHAYRVLDVIDNQVRSLRKRQLIQSYIDGSRKGAYWGIRTDIGDYQLNDALPCPHNRTLELARTPTRLKRLHGTLQEQLINWGYAVCDAALRKHVDSALPAGTFPYPAVGV
ncbi:MAG TPA: patatin-like phospholipase family protein [Gammaproteobacteria bacterium]|nr:patatin-like phospholipase family protein [Gammaproteobacteria bacterium]